MNQIRIGILGYGNLGKGVEKAVERQTDMVLAGIYSRRRLDHPKAKDLDVLERGEPLDVLILCGGSAADLPEQTPQYSAYYNVIDSYDHHQKIPAHYHAVDKRAKEGKKVALISCGWDPGLFSMIRALFYAVLPNPNVFTFWGKGISQGHSDAIRRINGVKDAKQYTVPLELSVKAAKGGEIKADEIAPEKMHRRECFVVAEEDADLSYIEEQIKTMPDYFAGYETVVHFISQDRLNAEHSGMPHGGEITGNNGDRLQPQKASFQLELSSNPDFTAGILTAYARAVYKLEKQGEYGCRTILDIPVSYLCEDMFMHM